jgi:hypothetical protein
MIDTCLKNPKMNKHTFIYSIKKPVYTEKPFKNKKLKTTKIKKKPPKKHIKHPKN